MNQNLMDEAAARPSASDRSVDQTLHLRGKCHHVARRMCVEQTSRHQQNNILDLIRAVAAAEVCLSHIRNLVLYDYRVGTGIAGKILYSITAFGHDAVIVFFLLSGYLVGGSVLRDMERGTWSWGRYLGDRFTRLWVVLLPALLLTLLWDKLGIRMVDGPFYLGTEGNWDMRADVAARLGAGTFFCNAAYLQTIACTTFGSNGALWSLANEFWYYLWFPAIYAMVRMRRNLPAVACLIATVVTMVMFRRLVGGFECWLLGTLAFFIKILAGERKVKAKWSAIISGLVLFGTALAFGRGRSFNDFLVAFSFFYLLLGILLTGARIRSVLVSNIATRAANFSYSLYLAHFPFALFLVAVYLKTRQPLSGGGFLSFVGVGCACYIYGYIVYWFFERNTLRVRHLLRDASVNIQRRTI